MFKRMYTLLLAVVLVFTLTGGALAAVQPSNAKQQTRPTVSLAQRTELSPIAETEPSSLYINGTPVDEASIYVGDGIIYCALPAFFDGALYDVQVVESNGQVTLTGTTLEGEVLTIAARSGDSYLVANDRCLYVADLVRTENGSVMVPVRVLAQVFNNAEVVWNTDLAAAELTLSNRLLTSGADFYDAQSLDLLSRVISAEAGNQPLNGKIAVGNVILNRVADSRFPNTIYDVIYQRNQFSVVNEGRFYNAPNAESVIAAKLTLEGVSILPTALYFNQAGLSTWASRNRPYVATIAGHAFYGG